MVGTSYFFVSGIEKENLRNRVKEAISYTEANIKAAMLEPETILAGVAQSICGLILHGYGSEAVQEYVLYINNYVQSNKENRLSGVIGFYGVFDVNGRLFTAGDPSCVPTENYDLQDCPWYRAAVEAEGNIGITQPHIDIATGKSSITFSRRIFDEDGIALGIVCLDINLDRLEAIVVNTHFSKESYGFLVSEDLEIIVHPSPSIRGIALYDANIGISASDAELRRYDSVSEFEVANYWGVESVMYIEKLYNGWYLGITTPKTQYYQSTKNLAVILFTLGTIMAIMLSTILMRLSAEKNKADERMRIMFDTIPVGASMQRKDLSLIDCNELVIKLFDLSGKQEYLDRINDLSPEYQPDGGQSIKEVSRLSEKAFSEGYCRFEWMHQNLSGEQIPCEVTLVRVEYDNDFVLAVYIRDLRELKQIMEVIEYREHLLNTVNASASILLSSNDEKSFDASLMKSFELLGYCLNVDRVHIWKNEMIDGELRFVHRYEWLSDYGHNCKPVPAGLSFPYSEKPEWKQMFLRGEHINASFSALPEKDRDFLSAYEMQSIVIIPMFLEDNFWGFFSVDDCRRERTFLNDEIRILTSVGLMMSNAFNRNLRVAKMREADERIKIMFNTMPLGAAYYSKDFKVIDCNEVILKIHGLSSKQEYTDNFFNLSPEYQSDGKLSVEKVAEVANIALSEGYCRFEWMHCNLEGDLIPCEITLGRMEYNGELVITSYLRDLREIKNTIAQMNESQRSLRIMENIMNGIEALIFVTIPDTGEIIFANDYMKRNFNSGEGCIGQMCHKILMDADEECVFCPRKKLRKEPDSTVVWEIHHDTTGRIHRCVDRYIEWYDGRVVHIQHSVDITEIVTAKEVAEQSSRYKSQFLSRMSHEVRTPMNAILGITEIQLQNEELPADMKEALGKISNSSYLLLGIINDILDMSKIEAGKLELTHAVYDVASIISDTLNINIFKYESKPIKFNLVVDENIPEKLSGDGLRIKQILNNLLSNAYKYTDKGEISMSVAAEYPKRENDQLTLVFRVADTGHGMTNEQLDKLFDEYARFNVEASRTVEGTGLGMSITKQLVKMMNGKISVESELGKGSVFTVSLPQGITGPEMLGKKTVENLMQFHNESTKQLRKSSNIVREYMPYGRVLIVDDMETNLYVARGLMAPYCLSVETSLSGFEAVEKVKSGSSFDIIFMDHFMPKMDGIETAKIIRELGYTHPIVALTANALAGMADMFMKNGFDGFVSKPIDIRQLNFYLNKFIRDKYPPEVVKAAQKQAAILKIATDKRERTVSDDGLKTVFVRDAEKALARMSMIHQNSYRRTDDIRQFVINAHAMKSTLMNIGEAGLSDVAFELEKAGRAENMPLILGKTPQFLEALDMVIEKYKLNENEEEAAALENSDNNTEFLGEKLLVIQTACEEYNEKNASAALEELLQRKWTQSVKQLLDSISEYLLHSDFDEAVNITRDYIKNNMPHYVKG
jgi:PAS domain S-box-containing protein